MGDHYANIATYEVHLGGPELLYHARMSAAIVAFVIAALRFLGIPCASIIDRDDVIVSLGERGHDITPRVAGLRPFMEKHDERSVNRAADHIVQPDAIRPSVTMRELRLKVGGNTGVLRQSRRRVLRGSCSLRRGRRSYQQRRDGQHAQHGISLSAHPPQHGFFARPDLCRRAQVTQMGGMFVLFSALLLPSLFFIGLVTFVRAVELAIEDMVHARGMARIRHYYVELTPSIEPYLIHSIHDDRSAVLIDKGLRPAPLQYFMSSAGMVSAISSVIAGVFAGMIVKSIFGVPIAAGLVGD